jgi:hypothetical protein
MFDWKIVAAGVVQSTLQRQCNVELERPELRRGGGRGFSLPDVLPHVTYLNTSRRSGPLIEIRRRSVSVFICQVLHLFGALFSIARSHFVGYNWQAAM